MEVNITVIFHYLISIQEFKLWSYSAIKIRVILLLIFLITLIFGAPNIAQAENLEEQYIEESDSNILLNVRLMDPTDRYPDGYVVFMNGMGQTVNPS